MANETILHIELPDELDRALKQAAETRLKSQTALVREILAEWLSLNGSTQVKQNTSIEDVFKSLPGYVTSGGRKHG